MLETQATGSKLRSCPVTPAMKQLPARALGNPGAAEKFHGQKDWAMANYFIFLVYKADLHIKGSKEAFNMKMLHFALFILLCNLADHRALCFG